MSMFIVFHFHLSLSNYASAMILQNDSLTFKQCFCFQTIPVSFIRECGLGKMEAIILQDQKGRSWSVRIAHWIGRVAMAKGWSKFRDVNHLKEGDVCVFEFHKADKAIRVHIFQAKENNATVLRRTGKKHYPFNFTLCPSKLVAFLFEPILSCLCVSL